jgi:hypothetical protein
MEEIDNLITCRICGEKCKRIYGKHLKHKHNGMSSKEYKKLFPGSPLMCKSDLKQTTKNSGKHMKEEKYKKMFSDMFSGEKNPNHKSNTTSEERKSRSPFSKEFKNYESDEERLNFIKSVNEEKPNPTKLEYWIDKGFTEDESIEKRRERQTTFNLDKCIEKYGTEDGERIFTERQIKWQNSLLKNGNLKQGYSKSSQQLFDSISINKKDSLYATNGGEFRLPKNGGGIWMYDFVYLKNKKIIEYNGDQYHANPNIFKSDDYPHPFRKGRKSEEIWEKDKIKLDVAKSHGFEVLVIWDSEYRKNKKETIQKCLDFLLLS